MTSVPLGVSTMRPRLLTSCLPTRISTLKTGFDRKGEVSSFLNRQNSQSHHSSVATSLRQRKYKHLNFATQANHSLVLHTRALCLTSNNLRNFYFTNLPLGMMALPLGFLTFATFNSSSNERSEVENSLSYKELKKLSAFFGVPLL